MVKRKFIRISARVYASDIALIDEEAEKEDMNRSDMLRKIVKEYVEIHSKKGEGNNGGA